VTLVGAVRLVRHYYHCRHCGQGFCPWDAVLGLTAAALSPAADEVVCLAGVQASFAEASTRTLPKLAGLRVAESTVERATEAAGRRVGEALAEGQVFGEARPWAWHKDRQGLTCAYVAADATGVGQQGPGGAKAEGRLALVGMVYNPVPEDRARWACPRGRRPAWQARYLAGLEGLESLGGPLRRQAAQVGMEQAQRWIALSDGGTGLEDFFRTQFGRVDVVILDFFHASEYLGKLAKAWHPADAEQAEALRAGWCHRLKHEGGPAMLEALQALDVRGRKAARETYAGVLTYFQNQVHRMDYPTYLANGWQIGSGPVESACKTVVGQRLKGGGMRWGADGADAVCHLRALFRSEPSQWDGFWHRNGQPELPTN
jgi:hypothetical protein